MRDTLYIHICRLMKQYNGMESGKQKMKLQRVLIKLQEYWLIRRMGLA